ncbi:hypothetical protein [Paenibacillus alvei]|uniref:hypothetical protein n=1 Tax=Paenibacillus alvei TaxID=44250 RepID=UPI00227FBF06|nr:hypothetical protein [Paenibacillus alvei]MCY7484303.1 hypothetical protein [Paenibacillus alvei]
MMQDMARFKAELGKKMTVGDKEVEIKLLVPLKAVQENFLFLSSKQGSEINVFLGDPQVSWQFDEEEMLQSHPGRYYTADQSGVVTNVQRKDDENDENQGDLFSPIKSEGEEGSGEEIEENEASGDEARDADSSVDIVEQVDSSSDDSADSDTPEWMREGDDTEVSFESEQSEEAQTGMVEEDEQQEVTTEGQDEEDSKEGTSSDVGKEELEQFILQHRPAYEDLPLDFPALLEKRLQENKTWREIANEAGMTSGQLSSRWSAYKKRVAEQMKDGGAA